MGFFPFSRRKEIFSVKENELIVNAIQDAEKRTSGEIRVYIERHCKYVNPLDRAAEIFWALKMDYTQNRNAVLVYIAVADHQFAIYADEAIHTKMGNEFWQKEVAAMRRHFVDNHHVDAIAEVIRDVGAALENHFPFQEGQNKNELPDEIIFGD